MASKARYLMFRCADKFARAGPQRCLHVYRNPHSFTGYEDEKADWKRNDLKQNMLTTPVIANSMAKEVYIKTESEENAVGIISGVPTEQIKTRTVNIYMPTKNAMQSGTHNTHNWQISFDTRERWENPLMGWCSSGDPLQALRVNFATKEAAIQHCINKGWKYIVHKPNVNNPKPRTYGENFSWDKNTRVSTK